MNADTLLAGDWGKSPGETFSEAVGDASKEDLLVLLSKLRGACAAFSYEDMVVENLYLRDARKMIALDFYAAETERRLKEMGRDVPEDVNFRSVSRLYLELADIVFTDLRDAGAKCFNDPTDDNRKVATGLLALITDLLSYGALHLSLTSETFPSQYRDWSSKTGAKCEGVAKYILYDGGYAPFEEQLSRLKETVSKIESDPALDALQEERNARYVAENAKMIDWGRRNVEKLNLQLELCDPYDLTQRRYLRELITATTDWLDGFSKDH
jgi:hypothetical protein